MEATRRKLVRWVIPLVLWGLLVQGVALVCGQTGPSLTPLVNRLAPGDLLVITINKDNTFDPLAVNNEVAFQVSKSIQKSQKAQSVSLDGRTITVLVPSQAQSGEVSVKAKGTEVGKVTLTITDKPQGNLVCLLMAGFPVLFFLIFLIWLGNSLGKKDSGWKLSDALSEQIEQKGELLKKPTGEILTDKDNNPIYEIKSVTMNSSSRLIAFIGLFVTATAILAIIVPASYRFACTGEVPDLGNFSTFILAQAGIFSPYVVNKITHKQEIQK